ncbi:MAG TPA: hypothetical protein VGQ40_00145 [Chthoniobacterales bacterium]|nr:hypothetical protein [Chthoniobacterales bacterium]
MRHDNWIYLACLCRREQVTEMDAVSRFFFAVFRRHPRPKNVEYGQVSSIRGALFVRRK